MFAIVLKSFVAFVSTNIDDLFVLMLFYGTARYKPYQIVTGQFLGIGFLVAIAMLGAYVGKFFDPEYVGLMGLFPIYLGLKEFFEQRRNEDDGEEGEVVDAQRFTHAAGILAVAGTTIANGGDNIGIYIPLFTRMSTSEKWLLVVVFVVMVYVWCRVSQYIAEHPLMAKSLKRYGRRLMPFVLVGLGVVILIESKAFTLLF